jgi:hypothetical protein
MLAKLSLIVLLACAMTVESYDKNSSSSSCAQKSWATGKCYKDHVSVNFESPTYTVGNINGQDGWKNTGAIDFNVATVSGITGFGGQSLHIQNGHETQGFGDLPVAKSLKASVGETSSTIDGFTETHRYRHFECRFDVKAATSAAQVGAYFSISADRGDGGRMTYLRLVDSTDYLYLIYDTIDGFLPTGDSGCTNGPCGNFVDKVVAKLKRDKKHTIGFTLYTPEGKNNDVVKVYANGKHVHTGKSWEDFYRVDPEQHAEPTARVVKTVLFRMNRGTNAYAGFYFDNLLMGAY